jgi:hypothetical protein
LVVGISATQPYADILIALVIYDYADVLVPTYIPGAVSTAK